MDGQTSAGDPPPQFLTLRSVIVPYPTTHTLANTIRRHAATDLDRWAPYAFAYRLSIIYDDTDGRRRRQLDKVY